MGVIFRKPCDRLTFIYESTERSTVYFPACLVWGGLFFQFYGFVAEIFGLFLKGKVRLNQETRQFTCLSGLWTQRTQQWAKQTRQVHRGAMKRQGSGAGNERWGYGAEKMPGDFRKWGIRQSERWQKTSRLDLRNTCKDRLKISAACVKSAGDPSLTTENSSRGTDLFSMTSSHLLAASETIQGNKTLQQFCIQEVSSHNTNQYPQDNHNDVGGINHEGSALRRSPSCVIWPVPNRDPLCLVSTWFSPGLLGNHSLHPACELTHNSHPGDTNHFTNLMWPVWRSLHHYW